MKQFIDFACECLKIFVVSYGENLYFYVAEFFTDASTMAEATLRTFYLEGRTYGWAREPSRGSSYTYGHFTQMLWRSTRKMGVGVAIGQLTGGGGGSPCMPALGRRFYYLYVVVKYDPPGNQHLPGAFAENVHRAIAPVD